MKTLSRITLTVILFVFSVSNSLSQFSADLYKKADSLVRFAADKVYYGNVMPVWIGKTNSFLYENLTPAGTEFIIVDAGKLNKKKAFNQEKFAGSLAKETGKEFDPGRLPIGNLVFSDRLSSFAFTYDNYNWICNLRDYSITKRERVPERPMRSGWDWGFRDELTNGPVESPDKKWIAFIKNFNVFIRPTGDIEKKEYQLSYDGALGEYYSSFIRWSPDSRKLVAYRVKPAEKHMIHYIQSSPEDQLQPKHYSYEYQKPGDAVPQKYPQLFDVEVKKHVKVDDSLIPNQYAINNIKWSRNSDFFTYEYNRRGHQQYDIIKVDSESGNSKVIIAERSATFIDYSGKKYRYDIEEPGERIWAS